MTRPMTQLQLVIRLSINCVAACDAGDHKEASRLMRIRDEEYKQLGPLDAQVFRDWAFYRLTDAEEKSLLATGAPS